MKKLLLLAGLFFVCLVAQAQPHIGIGAGVSDIASPYPKTGAKFACTVDAGYRFALPANFVFDPMLQLSFHGKSSYGILYGKVPLIVSYLAKSIEIGAGPYVAFGFWDQKNEPRYYDAPDSSVPIDPWAESAFGYFRKFDTGISARVLYHFSGFFCGVEGSYGLLDVARKDLSKSFSAHAMSLNIVFGRLF